MYETRIFDLTHDNKDKKLNLHFDILTQYPSFLNMHEDKIVMWVLNQMDFVCTDLAGLINAHTYIYTYAYIHTDIT
jgi:hypothetical protein